MDLLFPDNGLVYQLTQILTTNVKYRLFANNVTPTLNDTLATYTEASFAGYAAVSQNWSNFTINGVANHQGYALAPPVTFTNTSGSTQTVYGYYVTDDLNTTLLAAARFDGAPISIPTGTGYSVVPTWGDFSQLSS
jgi:hypothetical protein